jgi:hypothetical protein
MPFSWALPSGSASAGTAYEHALDCRMGSAARLSEGVTEADLLGAFPDLTTDDIHEGV